MKIFKFLFLCTFFLSFLSLSAFELDNEQIISQSLQQKSDNLDEFEEEFKQQPVFDPLSGYNKMMTQFNVGFYRFIARPVSKAYVFIVPETPRTMARNFFSYLMTPVRFLGNVLSFKFDNAKDEIKRFGYNTVFGFFGVIDAASKAGIEKHPADFGTVLGSWGVDGGFHIVLPFLGPSNLRDTLSLPINWYMNPIGYVNPELLSYGIGTFSIMNELSFELDKIDEIYFNTPNLYPFLRDGYEKTREKMIGKEKK